MGRTDLLVPVDETSDRDRGQDTHLVKDSQGVNDDNHTGFHVGDPGSEYPRTHYLKSAGIALRREYGIDVSHQDDVPSFPFGPGGKQVMVNPVAVGGDPMIEPGRHPLTHQFSSPIDPIVISGVAVDRHQIFQKPQDVLPPGVR